MTAFPVSTPPHLRSSKSTAHLYWAQTAVLALLVLASLFVHQGSGVLIAGVSLAGFYLGERAAAALFKSRFRIKNGDTAAQALVFAVMIPVQSPVLAVAAVSFLAAFMVSGFFGGLGQPIFHPGLMGVVILSSLISPADGSGAPMASVSVFIIAGLGGLLILLKGVSAELPLIYLGSLMAFTLPINPAGVMETLSPLAVFSAIFFLADPVYLPLSNKGKRYFSVSAGFAAAILCGPLGPAEGFCASALICQAFVGYFDQKKQAMAGKTYPRVSK